MNRNSLNSLKTPFFTVLFIFVFLYVFTKLFGPIPFAVSGVTTTQSDLFSVDGEGEATAVPDTATFSVGVTGTASTADAAKNQVTQTTNKIIDDIKALGIKETSIKTANYSVNPNQDFTGGRNTITGYTANQELQVKVDNVDLANKALDTATRDGANQVTGVTFTLNDEEKAKAEDKARRVAITNAKKKAQSIADAAGVRLGRIISVRESSAPQPVPMLDKAAFNTGTAVGVPSNVQAGENTVHITVTLSYQTL